MAFICGDITIKPIFRYIETNKSYQDHTFALVGEAWIYNDNKIQTIKYYTKQYKQYRLGCYPVNDLIYVSK